MTFSRVLGSLRILKAAVIFPITTLATCIASAKCVEMWPASPWNSQYSWVAALILPITAFLTANAAFRSYGATGAFGRDPVSDFRDVFRRILAKHVEACVLFLAPHIAISMFPQLSLWTLLVSLLFLVRMVCINYVDEVVTERARYENLNQFKEGLGQRRRRKATKGLRRK